MDPFPTLYEAFLRAAEADLGLRKESFVNKRATSSRKANCKLGGAGSLRQSGHAAPAGRLAQRKSHGTKSGPSG